MRGRQDVQPRLFYSTGVESRVRVNHPLSGTRGGDDGNCFKPRNPNVDFNEQKRTNENHMSRTDPELFRKGKSKPAQLSQFGNALTQNRHGLIMQLAVTDANRRREIEAAADMTDRHVATHGHRPTTLSSDRGHDSGEYEIALEDRCITPPGAINSQDPRMRTHGRPRHVRHRI